MSRPYSHLSGAEVVELLDARDPKAAAEASHRKSRVVQVALMRYLGRQGTRPGPSGPNGASLPQLYEPTYQRFNFASGTGERPQHNVSHPRRSYQIAASAPVRSTGWRETPSFRVPRILLCGVCACPRDSSGCGCPD